MKTWLLMCAIAMSARGIAQEKATVGDFTKSPTEHIINQIEQPLVVRSVTGIVTRKNGGSTEPLANVLFEIQGPGAERKIRRSIADGRGRFKVGHVLAGTYKFKVTLNGFQSVMGTIIVSKKAAKTDELKIVMPIRV